MADKQFWALTEKTTNVALNDETLIIDSEDWNKVKRIKSVKYKWPSWPKWDHWDVESVVWWTKISIDNSDTANPIINLDTLNKDDVWLWNVDNTTDADKPISTTTQDALDNKIETSVIIDEDDFASNSDTKIPTQQSVKAYIDANWEATEVSVNTDDFNWLLSTNEDTVQKALDKLDDVKSIIDNKEDWLWAPDTDDYILSSKSDWTRAWVEMDWWSWEDNVQADYTETDTWADSFIKNKPDLSVYQTTANMIDEDDMASDSDTKYPTQQSVKAYVDANGWWWWTWLTLYDWAIAW